MQASQNVSIVPLENLISYLKGVQVFLLEISGIQQSYTKELVVLLLYLYRANVCLSSNDHKSTWSLQVFAFLNK